MKKLIFLFAISFFSIFVLSCENDNIDPNDGSDSEIKWNILEIDGEEFTLAHGISYDFTDYPVPSDEVRRIDFVLATDADYGYDEWWYEGDELALYFEMYTKTLNKLQPGEYTLNNSTNSFSINIGSYLDYRGGREKGRGYDLVSAKVTILESQVDFYKLTFSGIDSEGRKISGTYNAEIKHLPNLGY